MALIAQIASALLSAAFTLALLATGFILDARSQKGKGRLAFELLVAGAVIVAVLVAIAASKTERSGTLGAHFPKQG
jgi:hypothetical protein